mmetsp:Transcript_13516/g.22225  ORF Transcript_13516/g.22225 Transcript_13516/m.22225 type:complete len:723 (+) Transcript_13516:28-2196(+)
MSAFKRQVQEELGVKKVLGENGHATLTAQGLGDSLLALFDRFFQGISERDLRDFFLQILKDARHLNDSEQVVNLFVMAFHTRWCRGGKGAKQCFYTALKILFEEFPAAVVKVLPLVPEFGYWKDLLLLAEEIKSAPALGVDYSLLLEAVWTIFGAQLLKDFTLLEAHKASGATGKPSVSFAGKWAPREGSHFDKQLKAVSSISKVMFGVEDDAAVKEDDVVVDMEGDEISMDVLPHQQTVSVLAGKPRKVKYRMVVSALAASLDVPEVKMAGGDYAGINISSVPSKCMTKFAKAFANEDLTRMPNASEEHTGNRFPDREDRVQCRQHLIDSVLNGKGVQGSQNYPHEYVEKVMTGGRLSTTMKLTVNAQWKSMRESILTMVEQRAAAASSEAGGEDKPRVNLGSVVPLSDVSGSMHGTPMMVSIALGILCSELTHESFRDMVLTFTDDAKWEDLGSCGSFTDKVEKLSAAPWGGSTNFYAAMTRVADVVRKAKLKQEDIPNLLVISDMQFDCAWGAMEYSYSYGACGGYGGGRKTTPSSWNTAYENIKKLFHDLGMEVHGEPLQPPIIIFWNVRGSVGYPAAADEEGVMLLSGYSPALMKFILSGEMDEEVKEEEEEVADNGDVLVKKRKAQITPTEAMKKVLYEGALDPVREALREMPSGSLQVSAGELLPGIVHELSEEELRQCGTSRRGGAGRGRGGGGRGRRVRGMGAPRGGRGRGRF